MLDAIIKDYFRETPIVEEKVPEGGIRLGRKVYCRHFKYDSIDHFESRKPDLVDDVCWKRIKSNFQQGDEVWMLRTYDSTTINIVRNGVPLYEHGTFMCIGFIV